MTRQVHIEGDSSLAYVLAGDPKAQPERWYAPRPGVRLSFYSGLGIRSGSRGVGYGAAMWYVTLEVEEPADLDGLADWFWSEIRNSDGMVLHQGRELKTRDSVFAMFRGGSHA